MENYYIVGGMQKNKVYQEWEQYRRGIILKVTPQANKVKRCAVYKSPKRVCPDEKPSIVFTAATKKGNYLYVGTQTEVLVYLLPSFKLVNYITLPCFNDIHHVYSTIEETLLVVVTGLDMVLEIRADGEVVREWSVIEKSPWKRFSRNQDYRKVPTTKPHLSHPNYVFQLGSDIWVTRCLQKDIACLTNPKKTLNIGRDLIHDGLIFGDSIYFTQVNGRVIKVDLDSLEIKSIHDFNRSDENKQLGWCRGIEVIDNDTVIVGFTRIRPTKEISDDGEIIVKGQYGVLPTRIACYSLINNKLLWEKDLEKYGMNAIYSIHGC